MKKIFLLSFAMLWACAIPQNVDVKLKELKYNEVMGAKHPEFEGRLFSISCQSSGDSDFVDNKCLENASETAFRKGYLYFTIKNQDKGTKETQRTMTTTNVIVSNGVKTYIPETHTYVDRIYHNNFDFILINDDELLKYDNYYIVDDYFPPKGDRV
ncbi:MAG: hypothetical protein K6F04_04015, partial [bacterium]|nr:hypothetical protein [bacterium]